MKLAKTPSSAIQEGDFTSMIDMVFQLIAFFMVLINFNDADTNEKIALPGSQLARPPSDQIPSPITLHLTRDDTVIIGTDEVPLTGLKLYLQRETDGLALNNKRPSDATVIIRGDRDAKTGKVQEAIKICQEMKFDRFSLRAKEDRGN